MSKLVYTLVFILCGCNYIHVKEIPISKIDYRYLKLAIFDPQCISCHHANGSVPGDLSTCEGVKKYVVPGFPENSLLCQYLVANKMPPGRPIPKEWTDKICLNWVSSGAPCLLPSSYTSLQQDTLTLPPHRTKSPLPPVPLDSNLTEEPELQEPY